MFIVYKQILETGSKAMFEFLITLKCCRRKAL